MYKYYFNYCVVCVRTFVFVGVHVCVHICIYLHACIFVCVCEKLLGLFLCKPRGSDRVNKKITLTSGFSFFLGLQTLVRP